MPTGRRQKANLTFWGLERGVLGFGAVAVLWGCKTYVCGITTARKCEQRPSSKAPTASGRQTYQGDLLLRSVLLHRREETLQS